jgi:hypothetical protein
MEVRSYWKTGILRTASGKRQGAGLPKGLNFTRLSVVDPETDNHFLNFKANRTGKDMDLGTENQCAQPESVPYFELILRLEWTTG